MLYYNKAQVKTQVKHELLRRREGRTWHEAYQQYQSDRLHGRVLTPDGLRFICASLDNDPEKIGKHMLDMLVKFRNEGLFDIVVEDE